MNALLLDIPEIVALRDEARGFGTKGLSLADFARACAIIETLSASALAQQAQRHEPTHTALRMCFLLAVSHPERTPFCPCHACTYLREIRDTFLPEPLPKEERVCWCDDGPLGFCPRHSDY